MIPWVTAIGMAIKIKAEHYLRLNGKYLRDAEALLEKGDYSQASEKFWGAAAEVVKAAAAKKGRRLKSHNELWSYVIDLDKKNPALGLVNSFGGASYLHSNFYEEELSPEIVKALARTVKSFVDKMQEFI